MSRNAKIIVGVVAGLLFVCVCGVLAIVAVLGPFGMAINRTVRTETGAVAENAGTIADFQLPPGYRAEATVQLGGFTFVSYAPGDGHSHIILVQAPASANLDASVLEQYAQQVGKNHGYQYTRSSVVGKSQATIRGQQVTLVIGEGTNSDGQPYRTVTGVFQGNGGPVLLSIESPLSSWNQAEVDAFIASIR